MEEKKVAVVIGEHNRSKLLGNYPEQKALKLAKRLGSFWSLKETTPSYYDDGQKNGMWVCVYGKAVYENREGTDKRDESPVRKSNNDN